MNHKIHFDCFDSSESHSMKVRIRKQIGKKSDGHKTMHDQLNASKITVIAKVKTFFFSKLLSEYILFNK